jgi:hypothetical protein
MGTNLEDFEEVIYSKEEDEVLSRLYQHFDKKFEECANLMNQIFDY